MTDEAADNEERVPLPGVSREWLRILEINPDAVLVLGPDERIAYANPAATRLLGDGRRRIDGRRPHAFEVASGPRAGLAQDPEASPFRRVLSTGRAVKDVEVAVRCGQTQKILSVNAAPIVVGEGGGRGVIASIRDVTERRRANARERLLAEAGRVISASLDSGPMLKGLAGVIVPEFADWCVLELLGPDGIRRFVAKRTETEEVQHRTAFLRFPLPDMSAVVVRTRTPVLIPELTEESLTDQVRDPAQAEQLRAAGARSLMCVALVARGHVEGAATFVSTRRSYDAADRAFATQLADRLGLALSNANLYRAAQEASAEAATQHARATEILESITDAFWALDRDWRFTYVNRHAEKVLGSQREELIGRRIWEAFPEAIGTRAYVEMTGALMDRTPRVFEIESHVLDSWLEVHVYPSDRGLSVYLHDIGARKRADAAQALLVDTGIALAGTLELDEILRRAARVAIPAFADLCTIDLVESGAETLYRAAAAAADTGAEDSLRRLGRRHPPDWRLPSAAMEALRTGEPVLFSELSDGRLPGRVPDPELLCLVQEMGARSVLVVPLEAHGRRLGVATFAFTRSGRRYQAEQVRLAGDLARRIASAIDNARLYEDAQASNRAKSNFISVISHEFRTPLTAIVGYSDLLLGELSGPITTRQGDQLGRIKASAWHLTHLVDEILTFSRMDAGRETVDLELVDLADVARRVAGLLEPVAAAKNLTLRVDVPDRRIVARSDTRKIRQILLNLLSNAVKFTDAGEVLLRLTPQQRRHVFDVVDTGIGIRPQDRERVFDSFWQVDQGTTRRVGGTGLGLTIARRLTHLLGGDIELTSEVGVGSTFRMWLPAEQPAEREGAVAADGAVARTSA